MTQEQIEKMLPEKREIKDCNKCNACESVMSCENAYADKQFNHARQYCLNAIPGILEAYKEELRGKMTERAYNKNSPSGLNQKHPNLKALVDDLLTLIK